MIQIKRPIVNILIGTIIGIIYVLYFKISIAITIIFLGLLIFLIHKNKKRVFYFTVKRRKIFLIFFVSVLISSLYTISTNYKYEEIYKKIPKNLITQATVVSEAKETEYYYSYEVKIQNKKFLMYVKKSCLEKPKYGMLLNIEGEYQEPQEARNYKGFNYKEYLKSKKTYGTIKVSSINVIKDNNLNFILNIINNIRNKIIEVGKQILPNATEGLLIGILIGERENISEEITESFSKSSLSHILAISGSHISYIIIGVSFILIKLKTPKKGISIITIITLILFMFITRFSPSVVRACFIGIIMLFSKIVYRKLDILTSMAISLLIILLDNPFAIIDIGLILSYLGALGIIYLNKPVAAALGKYVNKKITNIFSVIISAQIMVLPVTILKFNNISTVFLISNLLAVPLSGSIILLGYSNIFIGLISLKIAKLIAIFTHSLIQLLIWIAEWMAKIPYSNIIVTTPNIITVIIYYILIYSIYKTKFVKRVFLVSLIILVITCIINVLPRTLKIHFVDVGQRRLHLNKNNGKKEYFNRHRRREKHCIRIFIGQKNKGNRLFNDFAF